MSIIIDEHTDYPIEGYMWYLGKDDKFYDLNHLVIYKTPQAAFEGARVYMEEKHKCCDAYCIGITYEKYYNKGKGEIIFTYMVPKNNYFDSPIFNIKAEE